MSEYETISGGGGDYEEDVDREPLWPKMGVQFSGTVSGFGPQKQDDYGVKRTLFIDLDDGRNVFVPARKLLLERLEKANPAKGDHLKVDIQTKNRKKDGRPYGDPVVQIKRNGGTAPAATSPPQAAPVVDNEVPF